jgi:uridine kinase
VDEHTVRKGHPAEAELLHASEGSVQPVDLQPVLRLVERVLQERNAALVGIGGHGGAGKTTLARALPAAQVVSTDAFWNGSDFDLARVRSEVVEPIVAGRRASFPIWDWQAGRPGETQTVDPVGLVVIEGVCALHRSLREAYDVRVWVEAPEELRLVRGVERDGEEARTQWIDVWMPRERRYVGRDRPRECAHVVVEGSGTPPPAWRPAS